MALRSGLLMETTWALDTLNILLYDDNSIAYFGLGNMPGLLEALIEHWRASLIAVFDVGRDLELGNTKTDAMRKRKREKQENSTKGLRWYDKRPEFVERKDQLFVLDDERGWDGIGSGFEAGEELWAAGRTNCSCSTTSGDGTGSVRALKLARSFGRPEGPTVRARRRAGMGRDRFGL